MQQPERLRTRALMGPRALIYLYRRRLREHAVQELFAGLGVAVAVALVFAVTVANGSITGSAVEVVRAVAGPANLQLQARSADGFDEHALARVEHLPGVKKAAPLLERTATIVGPRHRILVDIAGADVSLALLDGLVHTLPVAALSPKGIGLSKASADALGIPAFKGSTSGTHRVVVELRGAANPLNVTAVLGRETFGALSQARTAVMPLARLQQLTGLRGRVTRILVQSKPGDEAAVRTELKALAGGRLTVANADHDVSLLRQALRPSDQASELFAAISALLGFLFAFNAILLTVPERREAIADQRLDGTRRSAIVQMVLFQALCLGVAATVVGLLGGYALSLGVFHQTPNYLAQAFTLGTSTVVGIRPLLLSLVGGVLATCIASMVPLLDLRRGQRLDAVYAQSGSVGDAPSNLTHRRLLTACAVLLLVATALFALVPSAAIIACLLLTLATMLAVPVIFAGVRRFGGVLAEHYQRLTILPVALSSLRARTLRSLALAATGAVALFGSVALGGSRDDLLRGIAGYASNYVGGADIWVVNPLDNQAINDFTSAHRSARIARLPDIASVRAFQGGFFDFANRRVWIIAWPMGARLGLLNDQIIGGDPAIAMARLRKHGWVTVSQQIATEHHARVGDTLTLPTPTGDMPFRIAATTTNFGWTPGAILLNTADYTRTWGTAAPSALGVDLKPGTNVSSARSAIERTLGPRSGVEVLTSQTRETDINTSASEGLGQLGQISTLLVLAAILAMAAALVSSVWQRRVSLSGQRLEGTPQRRLRLILLTESTLMLSAGCLTGAVAGVYGQAVIDRYLKHVAGFPVAHLVTGWRPIEIFVLVIAATLAIAATAGWFASRVSPALALEE